MAQNPVFPRLTKLDSKLIDFSTFSQFWESSTFFTVCKIGDFPSFLSALTFNNVFIIKLVKMWPGKTPDVVVRTLQISLGWLLLLFFFLQRSLVECCSVRSTTQQHLLDNESLEPVIILTVLGRDLEVKWEVCVCVCECVDKFKISHATYMLCVLVSDYGLHTYVASPQDKSDVNTT